jgi:hypothetical protein
MLSATFLAQQAWEPRNTFDSCTPTMSLVLFPNRVQSPVKQTHLLITLSLRLCAVDASNWHPLGRRVHY